MLARLCILVILAGLSGCAGYGIYIDLDGGFQDDSQTDYWLQTTRADQCDTNPSFRGEFGIRHRSGLHAGYYHDSWWLCGGPFNKKPEIYDAGYLLGYEYTWWFKSDE